MPFPGLVFKTFHEIFPFSLFIHQLSTCRGFRTCRGLGNGRVIRWKEPESLNIDMKQTSSYHRLGVLVLNHCKLSLIHI